MQGLYSHFVVGQDHNVELSLSTLSALAQITLLYLILRISSICSAESEQSVSAVLGPTIGGLYTSLTSELPIMLSKFQQNGISFSLLTIKTIKCFQ